MTNNSRHTEKAQQDLLLVREACREGNQQAFSELLDKYRDAIFFLLLKMTGNHQDAEDLTIETFGKAFVNIHQYNEQYAFSTWLFKIASNNGIDFIRKSKKNVLNLEANEDIHEDDESKFDFVADLINPEEKFIKSQKAEMVRQVVETLKPRYRQLILLRYFEERSYEEIASELDIPLGTVKAQLFRARDFLYRSLRNMMERI
ncbi:MAG: sigma-70 family RNA polymerase sigma factor [Bacteroidales bacterium]|nr:sigma-70 family RNA polymerase sigma factor [Bacteroidales bacterium]